MMRFVDVYSIIIIIFVYFNLAKSANEGLACNTPDDDPGLCLSLTECYPLYTIFKKRPLPEDDKVLLQKSFCGYLGSTPKVCCPIPFRNLSSDLLPDRSICGQHTSYRMLGGTGTGFKKFPWLALLEYENSNNHKRRFSCGGALISKRYVATAAHCVMVKQLGEDWKLVNVRLGEYDISSDQDCIDNGFRKECNDIPAFDVQVEESITHEKYDVNDRNQFDDIALVRLSRDVIFTDTVQPICLPLRNDERMKTHIGDRLTIAGWGATETKCRSNIKSSREVPVKSTDTCNLLYGVFGVSLRATQLCAGGEKGKDSCKGDSGGPLMALSMDEIGDANWILAGVGSSGSSYCMLEGWSEVYTRVSKYVPWIISKLEI